MKEALFQVVETGQINDLKELLAQNEVLEVINQRNDSGKTALHIAAGAGNIEMTKLLLAHGAKLNQRDWHGRTSLHDAAKFSSEDSGVVPFLCEQKGIEINAKDINGMTPLMLTPPSKPLTITCLLEAGADLRIIKAAGRTFPERCLPHREAFKAILLSAPNCFLNEKNQIDKRLLKNITRRIPRDSPWIHLQVKLNNYQPNEPSDRKLLLQLFEARTQMTHAYVILLHHQPHPDQIVMYFTEAFQNAPSLVIKELNDILDGKHRLLKDNQHAISQLSHALKPILDRLGKENFDRAKAILSSPDPPLLNHFRMAILQAIKYSTNIVLSEIETLARTESQSPRQKLRSEFKHLIDYLIKIAPLNSSESNPQLNVLLDHVAILLQQNHMDTLNQQLMNSNNSKSVVSVEYLKLSTICLLLKNPPEYNAALVYNLSELVANTTKEPTKAMNLDNLSNNFPQPMLDILNDLEQQYQTICGKEPYENQTSPFSTLKNRALKVTVAQEGAGNGNNQYDSHKSIPTWAKRNTGDLQPPIANSNSNSPDKNSDFKNSSSEKSSPR